MNYAGTNREVRDVLRKLDKLGCQISRSGSGHWRVTRPGRPAVVISHSPGDHHALRNIKSDLKKYLGVAL